MNQHLPDFEKRRFFKTPILRMLAAVALTLVGHFAQAQQINISGKVVEENGSPLPGVSVLVKGSSSGTTTDADGKYTLSAPSSATLVFSFIGFQTQEVAVRDRSLIDITMSADVTSLDEVVVIGSTIRSAKRELGNNISSINAVAIERSGTNNLFGSLQGKVPGAQITQNSGDPAGGMTIRLRGVKSLQGNSDPLYVIDGVIVSNSTVNVSQTALNGQVGTEQLGNNRLADLNPNDIESINIINGAAAAAQYGSRAANGVVLITTKRGKTGVPEISFSSAFNVFELRKKVPITTYGRQFGFANLRLNTIAGLSDAALATYTPQAGETFTPITRDGVKTNLRSNLVDVTRYDYQDQIFRTGYGTDNNLSVSGGTEKTKYFSSFAYSNNQGIIRGTDFERYNFRVRLEQTLTDWAKISAGITYANSFANEKANGNVFYSPINSINITNNIYDIRQRDANGNLLGVEPSRVNPLSTIEDMNFTQRVSRTVNDIQLNLTPITGLGIDWIIGVDNYSQIGKALIERYPYATPAYGLPPERYPNGYAATASNSVLLLNSDLNISYEKQLTDDFKLNAIVGANYQYQRAEYQLATGQTLAPFIETVSGASTNITASYSLDQYNLRGYFGQATIGYKELAYLTAAIRSDRSSKFASDQSNQVYPKLSGSFVPSDLAFWENNLNENIFTSLKLRASWGQAGNFTGIGSYDRFWQFNSVNYLGRPTLVPSAQLANSNLKPERMSEFEYGLDLSLLRNKVTLGVTMYNQQIEDLVVNRSIASSEGGTSIVNNVGEMENKGLEIMLNIAPIQTSDFSWDMTFIHSRNRNKITRLGTPAIAISTVSGSPVYLIEGAPASVFYGTAFARNEDGSPLLTELGLYQSEKGTQSSLTPLQFSPQRDAAGQPTGANIRAIIGNPNPDFTGSFVNNITYKNFGFNFMFDWVQGVEVFNADKRTRQGVGIGDFAEKEYRGEIPRGYIYAMYLTEEWRIDDGSFVKLREVGLSYNFNKLFKGVNSVILSVSGRNLFSFDNYSGYDPETNSGGNSDIVRGVDFGNVPVPRSYRVQLAVRF